jgi:hypothetical protein
MQSENAGLPGVPYPEEVYQCKCTICGGTFEGPKRAVCCPSCAAGPCVHGNKPGECDRLDTQPISHPLGAPV